MILGTLVHKSNDGSTGLVLVNKSLKYLPLSVPRWTKEDLRRIHPHVQSTKRLTDIAVSQRQGCLKDIAVSQRVCCQQYHLYCNHRMSNIVKDNFGVQ